MTAATIPATQVSTTTTSASLVGRPAIQELLNSSRQEYRRLVIVMAQGEDPGGYEQLNSLLFAVGRSLEELDRDVELVRRRLDLASELASVAGMRERQQAAETELAEVSRQAEELSRTYRERIEPILRQQQTLRDEAQGLKENARYTADRVQKALTTSADPAIDAEIMRLQRKHSDVLEAIGRAAEYGRERWTTAEEERFQQAEAAFRQAKQQGQRWSEDDVFYHERWRIRREQQLQLPALTQDSSRLQQEISDAYERKYAWDAFSLF